MKPHMSDQKLAKFRNGTILSKREFFDVCSHLECCEECLARLESLVPIEDQLIRRLRVVSQRQDRASVADPETI